MTAGRAIEQLTGRDLDALVETRVMGHGVWWGTGHMPYLQHDSALGPSQAVPHYSTDWAAMRLVVERMRTEYDFILETDLPMSPPNAWGAAFMHKDRRPYHGASAQADSAPAAVAAAALAAVRAIKVD
jgi:hypothetical protein